MARNACWQWLRSSALRARSRCLELAVPRALIPETGDPPVFDCHWADNIASCRSVAEFGVNVDSAPNRRWNYRFEPEP